MLEEYKKHVIDREKQGFPLKKNSNILDESNN